MLTPFSAPNLTSDQQEHMLGAAMQVLEAQQNMAAKKNKSFLQYILKRKRKFKGWDHYPENDRINYDTGAQYFYHCHRENEDTDEHGHVHCFIRYKQIPKNIKPLALDDWDKHIEKPMTHLVAIAINRLGQPIRLFTTNRWVASEVVYDAPSLKQLKSQFIVDIKDDAYYQPADKWVEGLVTLFAPQIDWLLDARDHMFTQWQLTHPGRNIYDDHGLEEVSDIAINLEQQIRWVAESAPAA